MEYVKEFDKWNIIKKNINTTSYQSPHFKEGEVWWAYLGVNVGSEIDGKGKDFLRPVTIYKKFSISQFLAIPMSTNIKEHKYKQIIYLKGKCVSVLLSQVKTISSKRLSHYLAKLDNHDFVKIHGVIRKLL